MKHLGGAALCRWNKLQLEIRMLLNMIAAGCTLKEYNDNIKPMLDDLLKQRDEYI